MRIVRMNDADIALFQFDYDLTWAAFFMNQHGHIYARYGARKDRRADGLLSKAGLARVMTKVLEVHKAEADRKPLAWTPRTPASFKSLPDTFRSGKQCMHCHQVWTHMRRDQGDAFNKFEATEAYPLPDNLGITFDSDLGNAVKKLDPKGPAGRAGVQESDEIVAINDTHVYSAADASWALHNAGKKDAICIELLRKGEKKQLSIDPAEDWKRRDISWRGSMWDLRPHPGFGGPALDAAELKKLGAPFGFRIQYIVDWGQDAATGANAKKAGLKKGDIVISAAGKSDFASELEFQAWFRLTQKPGTEIEIGILRDGTSQKIRMQVLP